MQIKTSTARPGQIWRPALRWPLLAALVVPVMTTSSVSEAKYASIVIDAKTGKVRHSINANTRNFPASLTKVMTLYLLFEAIDQEKVDL